MKLNELEIHQIGNEIQLTGAIYSGQGKHLLCFFPDETLPGGEPLQALDMSFEDWMKFIRQTDLMETEILERNPKTGELTKAIVRKSQRQIDNAVSWKVFRRDQYTCRYCALNDVPLTVDHVVLWEEGGPSIEQNLVSACKKCNRTRGTMQYEQWLASSYYEEKAKKLSEAVKDANRSLVGTLASIPRMIHKRSR